MRLTIHQPEHLPWLGFIYKVSRVDRLVVLDNVQFRKNYFGNRNRVAGPEGPVWVTVPVGLDGHLGRDYRDIPVADDPRWRRRYLGTLSANYGRHPFFSDYYPAMEEILSRPWERIADLNLELIRCLLDAFGVRVGLVKASELPVEGRSTELLLAICRHQGASTYLAGSQAGNYLDESLFEEASVGVEHTDFVHPEYPQRGREEFLPGLTALDALMNLGPEVATLLPRCGAEAGSGSR